MFVCDQAIIFVFSVECASQVQSAFLCALVSFNLLRHQEHKFVYLKFTL